MVRTFNRLITTVAMASLVVLPIAAQAETRAGDSGAVYSVDGAQPGLGRDAEGESLSGAFTFILVLFAAGLIGWGIYETIDDDGDLDQSPGT